MFWSESDKVAKVAYMYKGSLHSFKMSHFQVDINVLKQILYKCFLNTS